MNIVRALKADTSNGNGIRVTIFVSGCSHKCPGCQNPETWNENAGRKFTKEIFNKIVNEISHPWVEGITLSGGDPLYPNNREEMTRFVKELKSILPNKTVWCYTGYKYEEVKDLEIMEYINVLVDGKFHSDERDVSLPYCGSRNQRVIDVKETRKTGNIVLYKMHVIE